MNVSHGWESGGELCEEGWAQSGGALDTGLGLGFILSMMGRFWQVFEQDADRAYRDIWESSL